MSELEPRKPNHYFTAKPKAKAKIGVIRVYLRGKTFEFLTSSGVFSRKRVDLGTRLLIESMVLPDEGYVLDFGCGYGPVGIVAAALKPNLHVVMIDVNERAVRLARENAKRNSVKNVEIRRGYLYEPVENMEFNAILCNPPISAGMKIVQSIIADAPKHLTHKGLLEMVVRTKIGGKRIANLMRETFKNVRVHERKSGYRVLISEKIKTANSL